VELVSQGIKSGAVKPLPFTVYSSNEIEEAFRFMASGKHVGKVVIKVDTQKGVAAARKTYFSPAKSYVIIGGLGGFGLELAGWMT
jgi:fatty acid synthase